jgi:hypothetical protein
MANVVLLFGHGSFDPKETPAKATVPTGCKLCLFARHGEEVSGERMTDVSYYISHFNKAAMAEQADLLGHAKFVDEMKSGRHLRRIKVGGEQVHNYRLFPPIGLQTNLDGEKSDTGVKLVMVDEAEGITLQQLSQLYGKPGRVLMWLACRAIDGQDGHGVDGYNLPKSITTLERREGSGTANVYRRDNEASYLKPANAL